MCMISVISPRKTDFGIGTFQGHYFKRMRRIWHIILALCHRALLAKVSRSSAHRRASKLTPRQRAELNDILCDREEPGKHMEMQHLVSNR
jgi:hypothetical protein